MKTIVAFTDGGCRGNGKSDAKGGKRNRVRELTVSDKILLA